MSSFILVLIEIIGDEYSIWNAQEYGIDRILAKFFQGKIEFKDIEVSFCEYNFDTEQDRDKAKELLQYGIYFFRNRDNAKCKNLYAHTKEYIEELKKKYVWDPYNDSEGENNDSEDENNTENNDDEVRDIEDEINENND
jgi:hypothetical protein